MAEEKKKTKIPTNLKSVVPILCALQNILERPPDEILDLVANVTRHDSYQLLSPPQLAVFRKWLDKYGFEDHTGDYNG